ncbi:MAG: PspA/IM30 family protein, partial [Gemmatimonadaceae bacterium]|nr:PspA/IM30 family protein [Gemmatimonadaceae bacterium]
LSAGAPQASRQLAAGAAEPAAPAAAPAQLPAATPEHKTAEADLIAEIEQLGQANPRA